jgi:hypothetical protein
VIDTPAEESGPASEGPGARASGASANATAARASGASANATAAIIRAGGLIVGVWGAVLFALYGAFLTPLRLGGVLVPFSIVLAVVTNYLLLRFTYYTTEHQWLALIPGVVWVGLTFVASASTGEGDIVLSGANWVGSVYLLAGAATVGIGAYRLLASRVAATTRSRS